MKITAVIPAYNEATRIGETVTGVSTYVQETIVVDDGSADDTSDRARAAGAIVFRHPVNRGQGAALRTGTIAALANGADIVVHIDADGQHDPASITELVAPIERGEADVVFGSRFLGNADGIPRSRRALLWAARKFNGYVLGVPHQVTDPQSGLRALSAAAAVQIDFTQDRMAHCSEILRLVTRSSLRWKEIPTRIRYTADSLAKGQRPEDAFTIVWQLFLGAFQK